ncbi:MAG: patatin family protein [Erysipelotrichaceae bacterium]|nr:patatin family protein [Erysipelotrichaceae bacterium]
MLDKKIALVMEGGGMRGAYTAGALTWLIDNGIEFSSSYGISSGAFYLCGYLMNDKQFLYDCSTDAVTDKRYMFLPGIIRSGKPVDYDFLFNQILVKEKHMDLSPLKDLDREGFIGLYDLSQGKTVYVSTRDVNVDLLKAAASLPILGKLVKYNDREYFDGGITKMIPIEKAIEDGCEKFLIITTKPENYVRKPAKKPIIALMKAMYPQCSQISKDYAVRHLNYKKQIELIRELAEQKKAVFCFPSKESKVTRMGGTFEQLDDLFRLGYSDMEQRKESFFELIND